MQPPQLTTSWARCLTLHEVNRTTFTEPLHFAFNTFQNTRHNRLPTHTDPICDFAFHTKLMQTDKFEGRTMCVWVSFSLFSNTWQLQGWQMLLQILPQLLQCMTLAHSFGRACAKLTPKSGWPVSYTCRRVFSRLVIQICSISPMRIATTSNEKRVPVNSNAKECCCCTTRKRNISTKWSEQPEPYCFGLFDPLGVWQKLSRAILRTERPMPHTIWLSSDNTLPWKLPDGSNIFYLSSTQIRENRYIYSKCLKILLSLLRRLSSASCTPGLFKNRSFVHQQKEFPQPKCQVVNLETIYGDLNGRIFRLLKLQPPKKGNLAQALVVIFWAPSVCLVGSISRVFGPQ